MLFAGDKLQNKQLNVYTTPVMASSNKIVLMQTAMTERSDPESTDSENVRLLMDPGSSRTYVTNRLANTLGLTSEKPAV